MHEKLDVPGHLGQYHICGELVQTGLFSSHSAHSMAIVSGPAPGIKYCVCRRLDPFVVVHTLLWLAIRWQRSTYVRGYPCDSVALTFTSTPNVAELTFMPVDDLLV